MSIFLGATKGSSSVRTKFNTFFKKFNSYGYISELATNRANLKVFEVDFETIENTNLAKKFAEKQGFTIYVDNINKKRFLAVYF